MASEKPYTDRPNSPHPDLSWHYHRKLAAEFASAPLRSAHHTTYTPFPMIPQPIRRHLSVLRPLRNPVYAAIIALVLIASYSVIDSAAKASWSSSRLSYPPPLASYRPKFDHPNKFRNSPLGSHHPSQYPSENDKARTYDPNPIPHLITNAEKQWTEKLSAQTSSLAGARVEYTRRYGMAPPRGFDEWYEWAVGHGVKLVDEFDVLMAGVTPFKWIGGKETKRRAEKLLDEPAQGISALVFGKDRKLAVTTGDKAREFADSLEGVDLSGLKGGWRIAVNEDHAPRVLSGPAEPKWEHLVRRGLVAAVAVACGEESELKKRAHEIRYDYRVDEVPDEEGPPEYADGSPVDLCRDPDLLSQGSTLFQHQRVVSRGIAPLLGGGRPYGGAWADIIIASSVVVEGDEERLTWVERLDSVAMYGPPAGAVRYTGSSPRERILASGYVNTTTATASNAKAVVVEEPGVGGALRFEIQGDENWTSDRRQPWVHFVPVSPSAGSVEVGGLVRRFIAGEGLHTSDGDEREGRMQNGFEEAKRIAGQGKRWANKYARRADIKAWNWRVLIEMDRVMNGDF